MMRIKFAIVLFATLMAGCTSTSSQISVRTTYLTSGSSGTISLQTNPGLCYIISVEMPDRKPLEDILKYEQFRSDIASEMAESVFLVHIDAESERIVIGEWGLDDSVLNFSREVSYILRNNLCGYNNIKVDYEIVSLAKDSRYVIEIRRSSIYSLY